jgi:hypothetical protein
VGRRRKGSFTTGIPARPKSTSLRTSIAATPRRDAGPFDYTLIDRRRLARARRASMSVYMNTSGEWRDPGFDTVARIRALLDRLGVDAGADPLATASAFLAVHESELARPVDTRAPLAALAPPDDGGARVAELEAALALARARIAELEGDVACASDERDRAFEQLDALAGDVARFDAQLEDRTQTIDGARDEAAQLLARAHAEAEVIRRDALVTAEGLRQIAREDARELRGAQVPDQATSSRER